jgi:superfamily II DNA or RNA helicase
MMRQRVERVVVAAPPAVVLQWRDEMEQRFGLSFAVMDRAYLDRCRLDFGWAYNPWRSHTRFIVSHALLRDETYAAMLRDWLGESMCPRSMLVFDEAHHAAPATTATHDAIDSKFTRAMRKLTPRFEHRLFLSATPHNGLSQSFSALLELLDPQRFTRGVPVSAELRDQVMVRRLKADIRAENGGFAERHVVPLPIDHLPPDDPELQLSSLLATYAELRRERLREQGVQFATLHEMLAINLQKRLHSSIEAFHQTLAVHRRGLDEATQRSIRNVDPRQLDARFDDEDDEDDLTDEAREQSADHQVELSSRALILRPTEEERALLDQMRDIAAAHRSAPDARVRELFAWLRRHVCPTIGDPELSTGAPRPCLPKRVLIFTEYAATQRYLLRILREAMGDAAVGSFHGGMSDDRREEIKRAFNLPPQDHPMRVLVATDAAREGINLHQHCADLFHFDLPWNPSRIEQRNGRIDRTGQPASDVYCRFFVYVQRETDNVLAELYERTRKIRAELGSLPQAIEERIVGALESSTNPVERRRLIEALRAEMDAALASPSTLDLEAVRERGKRLREQLLQCERMREKSAQEIQFDGAALRETLSAALSLVPVPPLAQVGTDTYAVPAAELVARDRSWGETVDLLRAPKPKALEFPEWRRQCPPRPVVFRARPIIDDAVVHLHLEHRLVQRLLGLFLAPGTAQFNLSRACALGYDGVPRVVLFARLSLFGPNASRLHDEVVALSANWIDPRDRATKLEAHGEKLHGDTMAALDAALRDPHGTMVSEQAKANLLSALPRDIEELKPVLQVHARKRFEAADHKLTQRGETEAANMRKILVAQSARIEETLVASAQLALPMDVGVRAQRKDDKDFWQKRLADLPAEIDAEPERIRAAYAVQARRVTPVGVVYLWPNNR